MGVPLQALGFHGASRENVGGLVVAVAERDPLEQGLEAIVRDSSISRGGKSAPGARPPESAGMDRLKGKTALVVGGNTGIGREVCRLFARRARTLQSATLDARKPAKACLPSCVQWVARRSRLR